MPFFAKSAHFLQNRQRAHQHRDHEKLTIRNFFPAFAYDFYWLAPKTPLPRKTMHFALQYAAYWPAKPWVLQRKLMGFSL